MMTREERKARREDRREEFKAALVEAKAEAEAAKLLRKQENLKKALDSCVAVGKKEVELHAKWDKAAKELEIDDDVIETVELEEEEA